MGVCVQDNQFDDDSGFFHSGAESNHDNPSSPCSIKISIDDFSATVGKNQHSDVDSVNNMKAKTMYGYDKFNDFQHGNDIWDESGHICYDADDEFDKNLNVQKKCLSSTEDLLFRFCQDNQGTVYTMDRALSIIKEKPKLTKRFFDHSSYFSSSDESEFEIIESSESYTHDKNCSKKCALLEIPNLTLCSHCETDGDLDEDLEILSFHLPQNGLKLGKVRSLPNLRFPLRKIKKRKKSEILKTEKQSDRESSSPSSQDSYCSNSSQRVSLRLSSETSENEEIITPSRRHKKLSLQDLHEKLNNQQINSWHTFQNDIFAERERIRASTFCHTSINNGNKGQCGRFRIYSVPEVQNKPEEKNNIQKEFPTWKDLLFNNNNTNNNNNYTKEKEHKIFDCCYDNNFIIIEG